MAKTTTAQKATIDPADFEEFLELLKTTGQQVDELTPELERRLQNKCWTWIKNCKPKAVMPTLEEKEEIILKVYREKRVGIQYIYYRTNNGIQNKEFKYQAEQIPEIIDDKPTGKTVDHPTKKHLIDSIPTVKYTKALGEELVEKALRTSINPTFYIVQGNAKFKVDPEVFNNDFDETIRECTKARK